MKADVLNRMDEKVGTKFLHIGSKGGSKMLNRRMLLRSAIFATFFFFGVIDRTLTLGAFENNDEQHHKECKQSCGHERIGAHDVI